MENRRVRLGFKRRCVALLGILAALSFLVAPPAVLAQCTPEAYLVNYVADDNRLCCIGVAYFCVDMYGFVWPVDYDITCSGCVITE